VPCFLGPLWGADLLSFGLLSDEEFVRKQSLLVL